MNPMLSGVCFAAGSTRIAESGTPRRRACSRKCTASPRGKRSTVVGTFAPVNTIRGKHASVEEVRGVGGYARVLSAEADVDGGVPGGPSGCSATTFPCRRATPRARSLQAWVRVLGVDGP